MGIYLHVIWFVFGILQHYGASGRAACWTLQENVLHIDGYAPIHVK